MAAIVPVLEGLDCEGESRLVAIPLKESVESVPPTEQVSLHAGGVADSSGWSADHRITWHPSESVGKRMIAVTGV